MAFGPCERDLRIMRLAASADSTDRNQVPGLTPDGESPERVEASADTFSGFSAFGANFRFRPGRNAEHAPVQFLKVVIAFILHVCPCREVVHDTFQISDAVLPRLHGVVAEVFGLRARVGARFAEAVPRVVGV